MLPTQLSPATFQVDKEGKVAKTIWLVIGRKLQMRLGIANDRKRSYFFFL